jgi:hypothetical protein
MKRRAKQYLVLIGFQGRILGCFVAGGQFAHLLGEIPVDHRDRQYCVRAKTRKDATFKAYKQWLTR